MVVFANVILQILEIIFIIGVLLGVLCIDEK